MREPNYAMLPSHMRDGMRLWIEHGIDGGSFMRGRKKAGCSEIRRLRD